MMKQKAKVFVSLILALGLCLSALAVTYGADMAEADRKASALKSLGLFSGVTDTDFDLGRAPTRTEALIMLIRAMGKDTAARDGSCTHPFTDVPEWADKYIGYAYENGLTSGVSATQLGSGNASLNMFLTFMLRALGYNDQAGDFSWSDPLEFAKTAGIFPEGINTEDFQRADAVLILWSALNANLKNISENGSRTLAESHMASGVMTAEGFSAAKEIAAGKIKAESQEALTEETFKAAAADKSVSVIDISSDINISDTFFERKLDLTINIKKGATLTVSGEFTPVGCVITNDGAIVVSGSFNRGLCTLTNNGSVTVRSGGAMSSGVSDTVNNGAFTVDSGGELFIERGTIFNNFGTFVNNGYVSVNDGGQLNFEGGSIENNGVIDLGSYFKGDLEKVTGGGVINDNRD